MVVTAKCAHCGAQIVFNETDEATICKYCDAVNAIPVIGLKANTTESLSSIAKDEVVLREVLPKVKYAANHQVSATNSQGGHIWITDHELYFKPHSINIGDLSKRYIRIQDICGYEKGMLTYLTIYTKKGYAMKLAVWKKDEIIAALETKRQAYYKNLGEPVPKLTKGDFDIFPTNEICDKGTEITADFDAKEHNGMSIWIKIAIGLFILWLLGQVLI